LNYDKVKVKTAHAKHRKVSNTIDSKGLFRKQILGSYMYI